MQDFSILGVILNALIGERDYTAINTQLYFIYKVLKKIKYMRACTLYTLYLYITYKVFKTHGNIITVGYKKLI